VHLDVNLVIDQLDALFLNVFNSFLYMFRATSDHRENQLVSIYHLPVRRKLVLKTSLLLTGTPNSHPPECVIPDDVLTQAGPPDDEHLLLETCRSMK
jgi:hypothetical protein